MVPLSIPPLRERQGDILPLAYHFLDRYNERYQKSAVISRGAAQALLSYDWPGNVRQLQNCIESAVILCGQEEIDPADLSLARSPDRLRRPSPQRRGNMELREETIRFEGQLLRAVLEQCGGDRDETATGWASAGAHFTANGRKLSCDKNGTRDKFDTNKRTDLTQAG